MRANKTVASNETLLKAFVDRSLGAEKIRHPFRCTGRLFNVLSFGRFGFPSGGGWKKLDAKDSGTSTRLLMDVLWRSYWSSLPAIGTLYANGLELPEDSNEEELIEPPRHESAPLKYTQPLRLLPPPSGPEFIPELEAEIIPQEPLPEVDEAELAMQAEAVANEALAMFQGDHPRWAESVALLNDIEATLIAVAHHHPDKETLYERLAFVRDCHRHLDEFAEDFEHLMNTPQNPDDVWGVPWLARASQDLFDQQMMPTPENLNRASLPHYLVERWKMTISSSVTSTTVTTDDDTSSAEHLNTSVVPFRGPASDTESGF